jgi:hypothetical protein
VAASTGLFVMLALSFGLNAYLLFLQPVGVLSLRRLALAAGIGGALSAGVWFFARRRGYSLTGWWGNFVRRSNLWRAGLLLSVVLHLIYPAPPGHLFALPVRLELEFLPLSGQPAEVRLVSLNNGMLDVSYRDIRINETGRVQPGSGIVFSLQDAESGKAAWSGRAWRNMRLVFTIDQPVQAVIVMQGREERLTFDEGRMAERTITLPVGSWWYYGLVKLAIILLGGMSLAVVTALLRLSPLWEDG